MPIKGINTLYKRNTVEDYVKNLNPDVIVLHYGEHVVTIDLNKAGSFKLYRVFADENMYLKSFDGLTLELDINDVE